MPTAKSQRRGGGQEEKNRKGSLGEKASSFHGRSTETAMVGKLHRPRTVPDLRLAGKSITVGGSTPGTLMLPKLTKLLLNVTIQRSLGPVMVLASPESTVGDLIAAALRLYAKEGRRPILPFADPPGFDLHYSQFSLQSLHREEKLMDLGSRNFFLCPRKPAAVNGGGGSERGAVTKASSTTSSCSKQADKATRKMGLPWLSQDELKKRRTLPLPLPTSSSSSDPSGARTGLRDDDDRDIDATEDGELARKIHNSPSRAITTRHTTTYDLRHRHSMILSNCGFANFTEIN